MTSFRARSTALAVGLVFCTGAAAVLVAQDVESALPAPLRQLASRCGRRIGAAATYGPLQREPLYADTLAREFDILTPENEMKWGPIHPAPAVYDFARTDALVAFAAANGMVVHGHTLVWHNQLPQWLVSGAYGRDETIEILRDHIRTVAGRYSGRYLLAWDVVNEALNDDGTLRRTMWLDRIGPEYIELAFQMAAEADPTARLIYNDYGNEVLNAKSNATYRLVSDLLARGIPIHGVGFQFHLTDRGINIQSVSANMQRFADLGLEIYITELDVRTRIPPTADALASQARIYGELLQACLDQPACRAFQTWGFTDAHSWIPSFFPGFGAALIFDEGYQAKPAYEALRQRLDACAALPEAPLARTR